MGPRTLTVSEVAAILRVSTATIYKAIRAGVIPAFRVVGQFRVLTTELERSAGLDSLEHASGDPT